MPLLLTAKPKKVMEVSMKSHLDVFNVQFMMAKKGENQPEMVQMLKERAAVDEDIIKLHE